jgi:hypothetical protein
MRTPNLSLEHIYPPIHGDINLNTCHDPDCGNFGEAADLGLARPRGRGEKSACATMQSNTAIVGIGRYKMTSHTGDQSRRVSSVLEYADVPHSWIDARQLQCQFDEGSCDGVPPSGVAGGTCRRALRQGRVISAPRLAG